MEATLWPVVWGLVVFPTVVGDSVVIDGDSVVIDGVGKDVALISPDAEILLEGNDVATIGLSVELKSRLGTAVDNNEISIVGVYPAFDEEGDPVTVVK